MSSRDVSDDDLFDTGLGVEELAEQRAVRDLLRSLPDPGPVPPDVLDRITRTLQELQAGTVAGGPLGRHELAGATAVPLRRRQPHRAVWLAAAAALVLSGGGAVVSRLASDTSASESAASVASRTAGSAGDAQALAGRLHASGTDYREADLRAQARALLAAPAASAGDGEAARRQGNDRAPSPTSGQDAQRQGLQAPASADPIRACLRALGVAPADLLAADRATYQGRPALVLVVDAGAARRVRVMGPDCGPGATAELASARLP